MIKIGEYYRCKLKTCDGINVDDIVIINDIKGDDISIITNNNSSFTCKLSEFYNEFEYVPDGKKICNEELHRLINELDEIDVTHDKLLDNISDAGDITALAKAGMFEIRKNQLKLVKKSVLTAKLEITKKQDSLKNIIK